MLNPSLPTMPDVRAAEVGALRHALATAEAEIRAAERRGFLRGFVVAVANLVRLHGSIVEASDVLTGAGIRWPDIQALGLEEYDMGQLRQVRREIAPGTLD
jgi:hypothetical protein